MADKPTPPPEVPTNLISKSDKSTFGGKRYNRPRVTATTIAEALITARGDRKAAAGILGMSATHLSTRINKNNDLKARFSARAIRIRNNIEIDKLEAQGQPTVNTVDIITSQLEDLAVGQTRIAQIALARLTEIQDRLRRGAQARELDAKPYGEKTDEEKKYIAKYKFSVGKDGDPVEERMLMEHERAMMQEYARVNESVAGVAWKKAQTESLLRKNGMGKQARPARPSAPPKGVAPVTVVNQPGGNMVVATQPQ